jgi:hypothetical protein
MSAKSKIPVKTLREIADKLRTLYSKKKASPKIARILALLGRFQKKTDPIRKIEDFGGYYKFAMMNPGFRTQARPDTFTKMRLGWLLDAVAASLKRRSKK